MALEALDIGYAQPAELCRCFLFFVIYVILPWEMSAKPTEGIIMRRRPFILHFEFCILHSKNREGTACTRCYTENTDPAFSAML